MSIEDGCTWQIKKIEVNPGASLSLQMHFHRSEHWVVVSGTAKVEIGNLEKIIGANESVYIPLGEKHRLSNPTKFPLILIEIQSGNYLGEDDIKRFEDDYGRKIMKIIIIIEKYGGFCNRFFQSLHYHAFSIENNIYFLILLCWVY